MSLLMISRHRYRNRTQTRASTQEQDTCTDAQGIAAANAGKQTQDSLAAGILAGEILAGDNQRNTNADTTAGNDTQRAADANGQGTAGGIGDKIKQEREAIVGSVGLNSDSLVVIACLLLAVTAAGEMRAADGYRGSAWMMKTDGRCSWDYNSQEREAIAGSNVCSGGSFIASLDFATNGMGLSTWYCLLCN